MEFREEFIKLLINIVAVFPDSRVTDLKELLLEYFEVIVKTCHQIDHEVTEIHDIV